MVRIGYFKGWNGFAPVDVLAAEWSVLSVEILVACLAERVRLLVDAAGTPRARCAEIVKQLGGRAAYVLDGPARARTLAIALHRGVDVVVTGPVDEAAPLAAGMWHHGWTRSDLRALAGAAVAGLVLAESREPRVVELHRDGRAVVTKPPGAPGDVLAETLGACLTGAYRTPDVEVDLAAVAVRQESPDRVALVPPPGRRPPYREEAQNLILDGIAHEIVL
ncbi:acyclic terpene utilization AtuA family protein [Thermoactinospora rubra]|uniref:acyclic terpene utilization AtuA family protein n=1 Tax=Thermoactinospora rubra TaxID=1088767 RepID=UPI000A0FFCAC|nr:acyclic terpene utilization AtuA family protein [Thermoactinospora rubra]